MALMNETCVPCKTGEGGLGEDEITTLMASLNGWRREWSAISKHWTFKNFLEALAFVNKIGGVAEAENHHPDIEFGWGYVTVKLTSHAAQGLTRNDFIVAAKIDSLK